MRDDNALNKKTTSGKAPNITRRGLLVGSGGIVALLALGAVGTAGGEALVRPPGGQDEERLLSLCVRCQKCLEACPSHVIAPVALEGGLASLRTPTMNFHSSFCDFCENDGGYPLCVDACPTTALSLSDQQLENPASVPIGEARITENWCLAYRLIHCRFCYDACEYEAIELDEYDRPIVITDSCNGCGACESVCASMSSGSIASGATDRAIIIVPLES